MKTVDTMKLTIDHVTRIEGHGNVVLDVNKGKVTSVQWQVPEAPRFFEAFIRGRPFGELPIICSRVCGICSKSHTLASIKAVESALGIRISEQTLLLRRLAMHIETLQSHILHVGYLVAPDLFGLGNAIALKDGHMTKLKKVVGFHRMANETSAILTGRAIHPIRFVPGGFTEVPTKKELLEIRKRLEENVQTFKDISDVVLSKAGAIPDFSRETEYISLASDKEYAIYDGHMQSTDTGKHDLKDYRSIVNEYVVPHSTAKFAKHSRDSYMVGALARFNNNSSKLSPMAKEAASKFGLKAPCYNPFMNSVAQVVETFHCLEDSMRIADKLIRMSPLDVDDINIEVRAGTGVGAVEAPRGALFHEYSFDDDGKCTEANLVIPTNQNHGNIQKDLEEFAPTILNKSQPEIELNLEMLVRAYDPCVSCSTHLLKVTFV